MFAKLLIANRGEIACRVEATARRLGIATVAVFSDADRGAKHVEACDEAVHIGPAPAAESYLRGDRIIAAAVAAGAGAIHPGYGFLSENAGFAEAVAAAGLTFVGPSPAAIRAMGLKDAAKALMARAGVPIVPGYHGPSRDPMFLAGEAEKIGYPVLIKARAGGGGKGMRRVDGPGDFAGALESAQREAQSSFGDPACLIEKYVTRPRHIEIQIFGDSFGEVVHLFERDCSLQRRHQKVIEEAPAPGMTAEIRAAMGAAAVAAAKAVDYCGAGTVEFIVDGSGPPRSDGFWFMEMNTRLQVEHPVTEAITGLDLVELQLRVASGERLPFAQGDLAIDGHAFEARIYAEDPERDFAPATGRLTHVATPGAAAFAPGPVRIDSGVRAGDVISPHYDPMIAKLIAHGPDRETALARLAGALAAVRLAGVVANVGFLQALARHHAFARGAVDTGLIARDMAGLRAEPSIADLASALAALCALGLTEPPRGDDPWARLVAWRQWPPAQLFVAIWRGGERLERRVAVDAGGYRIVGGAAPLHVTLDGEAATIEGRRLPFGAVREGADVTIFIAGATFAFTLADELATQADAAGGGDFVTAPMPGVVRAVLARLGEPVGQGAPLILLEAMKMEHALGAPRAGTIAEILVQAGDQVAAGAALARLAPEAD